MGELGGSRGHLEGDKVRHDDAQSWMRTNFETEYIYCNCGKTEERRGCATGAHCSHKRVRSASGSLLRDFLFVDGIVMSEEEYAEVYAKPDSKAKNGVRRQPSFGAHSDPGYGDGDDDPPYVAVRSHSIIDRVSSWLQEVSWRGDSRGFQSLQHAYAQPSRSLTPRRPYPRNHDAALCSSPRSIPGGSQHHGVAQHIPSADQCSSDNQPDFKTLSPGSIYRGPGDQRPLSTKALDFVKKGAEGIASVSRMAAAEIAKVSRTTSMELKNLAAPVLAPIFQAVMDEGRDQLTDQGSDCEHVQRQPPNPAELERMAIPYAQRVGRG